MTKRLSLAVHGPYPPALPSSRVETWQQTARSPRIASLGAQIGATAPLRTQTARPLPSIWTLPGQASFCTVHLARHTCSQAHSPASRCTLPSRGEDLRASSAPHPPPGSSAPAFSQRLLRRVPTLAHLLVSNLQAKSRCSEIRKCKERDRLSMHLGLLQLTFKLLLPPNVDIEVLP